MELKKPKAVTTDKFISRIGKSLGQETIIRTIGPEFTVVYKDMDESTIQEEVC